MRGSCGHCPSKSYSYVSERLLVAPFFHLLCSYDFHLLSYRDDLPIMLIATTSAHQRWLDAYSSSFAPSARHVYQQLRSYLCNKRSDHGHGRSLGTLWCWSFKVGRTPPSFVIAIICYGFHTSRVAPIEQMNPLRSDNMGQHGISTELIYLLSCLVIIESTPVLDYPFPPPVLLSPPQTGRLLRPTAPLSACSSCGTSSIQLSLSVEQYGGKLLLTI